MYDVSAAAAFWNWAMVATARFLPVKIITDRAKIRAFAKATSPVIKLVDPIIGEKVKRPVCYTVVTCLTCLLHGCYMSFTRLLHVCYTVVTCLTWLLHVHIDWLMLVVKSESLQSCMMYGTSIQHVSMGW